VNNLLEVASAVESDTLKDVAKLLDTLGRQTNDRGLVLFASSLLKVYPRKYTAKNIAVARAKVEILLSSLQDFDPNAPVC
jgi:hypothetical protein